MIPTRSEIPGLPRWAQVALAARCARRVRPFVARHWPDAPAEHLAAVDHAIGVAEHTCAHTYGAKLESVDRENINQRAPHVAGAHASAAAHAAALAAECAVTVSRQRHGEDEDRVMLNTGVTHATCDAVRAASRGCGGCGGCAETRTGIRADFDLLVRLAREQGWDDSTPVPSDVFAPLADQAGTAM